MRTSTTLLPLAVVGYCLSLAAAATGHKNSREDGHCGPGNLAANGQEAVCEPIPPFPTCCQKNGHCGWDCEGSKCEY